MLLSPCLRVVCTLVVLFICVAAPSSRAQQQPADAPGTGSIVGRVVDSESAAPAEGVTVTVTWPAEVGSEPHQETRLTDAQGAFEMPSVPAGRYGIRFTKPGYRESTLGNFEVVAGQPNRADVSLSPETAAAPEPVLPDVEEFVIIASPVAEILAASRMDADELINTMGAAEFEKLAIGDVADALKFVPGVNVVEGQFAVIRGLEDRYSSTLYNSAPGAEPRPRPPVGPARPLPVRHRERSRRREDLRSGSAEQLLRRLDQHPHARLPRGVRAQAERRHRLQQPNAWDRFLEFDERLADRQRRRTAGTPSRATFGALLGGRTRGSSIARSASRRSSTTRSTTRPRRASRRARAEALPQPGFQPCQPGDVPDRAGDLALGELVAQQRQVRPHRERALGAAHRLRAASASTSTKRRPQARRLRRSTRTARTTIGAAQGERLPPGLRLQRGSPQLQADGEEIQPQRVRRLRHASTRGSRGACGLSPTATPSRGPLWFASFIESKSFETERDLAALPAQRRPPGRARSRGCTQLGGATMRRPRRTRPRSARGTSSSPTTTRSCRRRSSPSTLDDLGPGRFAANSGLVSSRTTSTRTRTSAASTRSTRPTSRRPLDARGEHRRLVRAREARRQLDASSRARRSAAAAVRDLRRHAPRSSAENDLRLTSIARRTAQISATREGPTSRSARSRRGTSASRAPSGRTSICSAASASSRSSSSRSTIRSRASCASGRPRPSRRPTSSSIGSTIRRAARSSSRRRPARSSTTSSSASRCRSTRSPASSISSTSRASDRALVNGEIDETQAAARRSASPIGRIEGLNLRGGLVADRGAALVPRDGLLRLGRARHRRPHRRQSAAPALGRRELRPARASTPGASSAISSR